MLLSMRAKIAMPDLIVPLKALSDRVELEINVNIFENCLCSIWDFSTKLLMRERFLGYASLKMGFENRLDTNFDFKT